VLLLYLLAATLAAVAVAAELASGLFLPLLVLAGIGLVLFGVFLAEVNPYGEIRRGQANAVAQAVFRYGRFGSEVLLDVSLLTVALYTSYLLRFEEQSPVRWLSDLAWSLPILVSCQLGALVVFRVYRTLWRYVGVGDALNVLRALAVANLVGFVAIGLIDPSGILSRAVFVLDWLAASLLVIGARSLLVWLRQWFARMPRQGERSVIIVGASDIGELAHRLLGHQEGASYRTIGFLDDDRGKHYRRIAGVPVLGATTELASIARRLKPDLVLDTGAGSPGKVRDICRELDIEWRPFAIPALANLESSAPLPLPKAAAARPRADAASQPQ
jgi:FlaA1/EpsC-like NDP-sugar epimerase